MRWPKGRENNIGQLRWCGFESHSAFVVIWEIYSEMCQLIDSIPLDYFSTYKTLDPPLPGWPFYLSKLIEESDPVHAQFTQLLTLMRLRKPALPLNNYLWKQICDKLWKHSLFEHLKVQFDFQCYQTIIIRNGKLLKSDELSIKLGSVESFKAFCRQKLCCIAKA